LYINEFGLGIWHALAELSRFFSQDRDAMAQGDFNLFIALISTMVYCVIKMMHTYKILCGLVDFKLK
jgi:hypothetical protein